MIVEIWKPIKDWEFLYEVSNLGRVKSLERKVSAKNGAKRTVKERILKFNDSRGYLLVHLSKSQHNTKGYKVHRLVAEAFIPNPQGKPCVNHINGIKTDNRVENLEWVTHLENSRHATDTGLLNPAKGESSGKSVLCKEEVLEICNILDEGKLPYSKIASKFGISCSGIEFINSGRTWNHLTGRKGNCLYRKECKTPVINCRGEYFKTLESAANIYNTHPSSISRVCRGERKTSGKYKDGTRIKWKYAE